MVAPQQLFNQTSPLSIPLSYYRSLTIQPATPIQALQQLPPVSQAPAEDTATLPITTIPEEEPPSSILQKPPDRPQMPSPPIGGDASAYQSYAQAVAAITLAYTSQVQHVNAQNALAVARWRASKIADPQLRELKYQEADAIFNKDYERANQIGQKALEYGNRTGSYGLIGAVQGADYANLDIAKVNADKLNTGDMVLLANGQYYYKDEGGNLTRANVVNGKPYNPYEAEKPKETTVGETTLGGTKADVIKIDSLKRIDTADTRIKLLQPTSTTILREQGTGRLLYDPSKGILSSSLLYFDKGSLKSFTGEAFGGNVVAFGAQGGYLRNITTKEGEKTVRYDPLSGRVLEVSNPLATVDFTADEGRGTAYYNATSLKLDLYKEKDRAALSSLGLSPPQIMGTELGRTDFYAGDVEREAQQKGAEALATDIASAYNQQTGYEVVQVKKVGDGYSVQFNPSYKATDAMKDDLAKRLVADRKYYPYANVEMTEQGVVVKQKEIQPEQAYAQSKFFSGEGLKLTNLSIGTPTSTGDYPIIPTFNESIGLEKLSPEQRGAFTLAFSGELGQFGEQIRSGVQSQLGIGEIDRATNPNLNNLLNSVRIGVDATGAPVVKGIADVFQSRPLQASIEPIMVPSVGATGKTLPQNFQLDIRAVGSEYQPVASVTEVTGVEGIRGEAPRSQSPYSFNILDAQKPTPAGGTAKFDVVPKLSTTIFQRGELTPESQVRFDEAIYNRLSSPEYLSQISTFSALTGSKDVGLKLVGTGSDARWVFANAPQFGTAMSLAEQYGVGTPEGINRFYSERAKVPLADYLATTPLQTGLLGGSKALLEVNRALGSPFQQETDYRLSSIGIDLKAAQAYQESKAGLERARFAESPVQQFLQGAGAVAGTGFGQVALLGAGAAAAPAVAARLPEAYQFGTGLVTRPFVTGGTLFTLQDELLKGATQPTYRPFQEPAESAKTFVAGGVFGKAAALGTSGLKNILVGTSPTVSTPIRIGSSSGGGFVGGVSGAFTEQAFGREADPLQYGIGGAILGGATEAGMIGAQRFPVRYGEVKIRVPEGTAAEPVIGERTLYRGVYYQAGEGRPVTPLVGIAEGRLITGRPRYASETSILPSMNELPSARDIPSFSQIALPEYGVASARNLPSYPQTALETEILASPAAMRSAGFPLAEIKNVDVLRRLLSEVKTGKNVFVENVLPKSTKILNEAETRTVIDELKLAYKRGDIIELYGSYPEMSQRAPQYKRTPNDIEVQFKNKGAAERTVKTIVEKLKARGTTAELDGVAVNVRGQKAIDTHYAGEPVEGGSYPRQGMRYGFVETLPTKNIEGLPVGTLEQQLVRKAGASGMWQELRLPSQKEPIRVVQPAEQTPKSVADAYAEALTMLETRKALGLSSPKELAEMEGLLKDFRKLRWRNPEVETLLKEVDENAAAYLAKQGGRINLTDALSEPRRMPSALAQTSPALSSGLTRTSPALSSSAILSRISPSASALVSPSSAVSASPRISPSLGSPRSPSLSASASARINPSISPSASASQAISASPSVSASPSASASPRISPSISPSVSPSISPSISPAITSPSISPRISPSISPSLSLRSPSPSSPQSPVDTPPPPPPPIKYFSDAFSFDRRRKKRRRELSLPPVSAKPDVLADLLSVWQSQVRFGTATQPNMAVRPAIARAPERTVSGRIPTVELIRGAKPIRRYTQNLMKRLRG